MGSYADGELGGGGAGAGKKKEKEMVWCFPARRNLG